MRIAVIDLGTNTFHLIIAEIYAGKEAEIIYKTNEPVRLGQGAINENTIIPEAFERGINTLKQFKQEIQYHEALTVKAIATSAVRSARNGADFVAAAKRDAGIDITVIDGDQEAEYIYHGVSATGAIKSISLIMDIGGGSTEFILCDRDNLIWKKSYDIGAARLMQAYFKSDPISEAERNAIIGRLEDTLQELKQVAAIHRPSHLIGSAGAFETFAGLILNTNVKELKSVGIPLEEYLKLSGQLINSTHAEREQIPGLIQLRVDMIVIAAILTDYIIKELAISELSLSTYDLKMGVLESLKRQ